LQTEVIGNSLHHFLHPSDVEGVIAHIKKSVKQVLDPSGAEKESERIIFECRLKEKNQPRLPDQTTYRTVRVSGHITTEFAENDLITDELPQTRYFFREHSIQAEFQQQLLQQQQQQQGATTPNAETPPGNGSMRSFSFSSSSVPVSPSSECYYQDTYSYTSSPPSAIFTQTRSCSYYSSPSCSNVPPSPYAPSEQEYNPQCYAPHIPLPIDQSDISPTETSSSSPPPQPSSRAQSPTTVPGTNLSLSKMLFLCYVEVIPLSPPNELKLSDANFDEYVSRHCLDGTLLYTDQRMSSVLGFLPSEVKGKSAYDYIIPEDYSIALFAHKLSE